jgi:hypothetical protein
VTYPRLRRTDSPIEIERRDVPECIVELRKKKLIGSSLWQLLGLGPPPEGLSLWPEIPADAVSHAHAYLFATDSGPGPGRVVVPALNLTSWDWVMLIESDDHRQTYVVSTGSLAACSDPVGLITVAALFEVDVEGGEVVDARFADMDWL